MIRLPQRLLPALLAGLLAAASPVRASAQQPANPAVLALDGITPGWLDTLRAIAGDVVVDTLPTVMQVLDYSGRRYPVGGWYNNQLDVVFLNPHPEVFDYLHDNVSRARVFTHPAETTNPSGVLAHEFGHRFQLKVLLRPDGVREPGDTVPSWAQGNAEVFADRFAVVLLRLRTPAAIAPVLQRGNDMLPVPDPTPSDVANDILYAVLTTLLKRNLP